MADFNSHIIQAKNNIQFFNKVNNSDFGLQHIDWQVTTLFYVMVHAANAHIAKISNLHFRTHKLVYDALNPESRISSCKWDEDTFQAYQELEHLSRISRYLCNTKTADDGSAFICKPKHLYQAIKSTDILVSFMKKTHNVELVNSSERMSVKSPFTKYERLNWFEVIQP